jgi:UDP-N-acetylmuramoylalanine--D-glutamate ligase
MQNLEKLKKALDSKIKTNEPLGKHTTLKIGGPARLYLEAESEEVLKKGVSLARAYNIPFFIIGEGSNLLIHEKGFRGLVIRNKIIGIKVKDKKVWVKTGTKLQDLVDFLIEKGLVGMQKMAGIPGTVGGAIYGKRSDLMLLEAEFDFEKDSKTKLRKEADKILEIRLKKYRPEILCPGSFFKNILASDLSPQQIKKIPKEKIVYGKIPAGYLLEEVGAKGAQKGKIKIADYHANFFMNLGKGKATDFYKLAEKYKKKVKEKFGIELEPEVQLVGFDEKIAVLGFGIEGKDLVKFLLKKGADITVLDQKEEKELDFEEIDKSRIKLITGKDYLSGELGNFDIIFRSPGVYRYLPELVKAEEKGVEIFSANKLFFDLCPAKVIGVTGTKGKGTTASLIYQILKSAGKDVYLAGNIGKPYLELLPKLKKSSWVVLELSSFQLIDMDKSPQIAVVLNITVDHLDWHKDREEYVEAKTHIVKHQKKNDFAAINTDYKESRSFSKLTKARIIFFSKNSLDKKFKENLLLRGEHNLENSFATGPQPTIAAIKSFKESTTVVLGGSEKELNYSDLGKVIANKDSVKCVILIGEVAPKIKGALARAGFQGKILGLGKSKMSVIVKKAFSKTPKGGVVLLSPAAASFDMFENYKGRGKQFKKAIKTLKK